MKVVLVNHPGSPSRDLFLFSVPEGQNLSAGDYVLCETKKSPEEIGLCVTDSYELNSEKILKLMGVASPDKLKPVVGRLYKGMFAK